MTERSVAPRYMVGDGLQGFKMPTGETPIMTMYAISEVLPPPWMPQPFPVCPPPSPSTPAPPLTVETLMRSYMTLLEGYNDLRKRVEAAEKGEKEARLQTADALQTAHRWRLRLEELQKLVASWGEKP